MPSDQGAVYAVRARCRLLVPLHRRGHAVDSIASAIAQGLISDLEWVEVLRQEKEAWERETGRASLAAYTPEERSKNAKAQRAGEKGRQLAIESDKMNQI